MSHSQNADQKLLADIEKFGLSVIHVGEDDRGPAYAFSIGLFQTYQHPEVIMFGLSQEAMHTIINNIAFDIEAGTRYEVDSLYGELLPDYDCAFREVNNGWYPHYLGYACWYYRGSNFPVIQCIWPDKHQNFPWDDDFNEAWLSSQPLLYGSVGRDPLVTLDSDWPFRDARTTATFTGRRVMEGETPILFVAHDYSDGSWQFLDCSDLSDEDSLLVSIGNVAARHPDILALADLPLGWQATRVANGMPWERRLQSGNSDRD